MKHVELIRQLNAGMVAHKFQLLDLTFGGCSCRLVVSPASQEGNAESPPSTSGPSDAGLDGLQPSSAPEPLRMTAERVGVFRARKDPLQPGQPVAAGEVLGTIRGISFQDQIAAPREGRLSSIHIEDGEIVEFGRLLFCLEAEPNGR